MRDTTQEIIAMEEDLGRAEVELDAAALDSVFSDDMLITTPLGTVCGKADAMAELQRARNGEAAESVERTELQVRAFGDAAVASYRLTTKGQYQGATVENQFRFTNVWVRKRGRWQLVARHLTAIQEAPSLGGINQGAPERARSPESRP